MTNSHSKKVDILTACVEITYNFIFNILCLFFFFSDKEMLFTGKGKTFCIFQYVQVWLNKTMQLAFVREFIKNASTANADLDMALKAQRKKVVDTRQKELDNQLDVCQVRSKAFIENLWNCSWNSHIFEFLIHHLMNKYFYAHHLVCLVSFD